MNQIQKKLLAITRDYKDKMGDDQQDFVLDMYLMVLQMREIMEKELIN